MLYKRKEDVVNSEINWTAHNEFPENTIYCRCEAVFRSHNKLIHTDEGFVNITRKSCPNCGSDRNTRKSSSDKESFSLRRG